MVGRLEKAPESRGKAFDRLLSGLEGRSLVVEGVDVFDGPDVVDEKQVCVVIGRLERVLDGSAHLLDGPERMTDRAAWLIVGFGLVTSGSQWMVGGHGWLMDGAVQAVDEAASLAVESTMYPLMQAWRHFGLQA